MSRELRRQLSIGIAVSFSLVLIWLIGSQINTSAGGLSGQAAQGGPKPIVGQSAHNDVSPPLRDIPPVGPKYRTFYEANANPPLDLSHVDLPDPVVQRVLGPLAMPAVITNFEGIAVGGGCGGCAPPDTNGEAGLTQYVETVNSAYQVFDKSTGASLLGPADIQTLWSGFGGFCETDGSGDPVVLYDQLADRWLISQFAGPNSGTNSFVATEECIAVSTSADATGNYNRYDFHLGDNFFDYPKLGVWPDAYYMGENVFNAAGTTYLGPQPLEKLVHGYL